MNKSNSPKTHKGKPLKEATLKELNECLKWWKDIKQKYHLYKSNGLFTESKNMIPILKAEIANRIGKK